EPLAIGRKGHGPDFALVPLARRQFFLVGQVPAADGAVLAGRGYYFAVRREDPGGFPSRRVQPSEGFVSLEVEEVNGRSLDHGQHLAGGGEHDAGDGPYADGVIPQSNASDLLPSRCVPQLDGLSVGDGQRLAVRGETVAPGDRPEAGRAEAGRGALGQGVAQG